jgi:hypothetical protein
MAVCCCSLLAVFFNLFCNDYGGIFLSALQTNKKAERKLYTKNSSVSNPRVNNE